MSVLATSVARARFVLARRPWLYWLAVAVLGAVIAFGVHRRLAALDDAAASWGETRRVLVADRALVPGDAIAATSTDLPTAMVPPGALTALPDGARLRQQVGVGEILVDIDIATQPGPASGADAGTMVVAITDPTARATIGTPVAVAADGSILAHRATVTDLVDGITFLAVDEHLAATVAAAALEGRASLLYLP